jgi:hypothetical protein
MRRYSLRLIPLVAGAPSVRSTRNADLPKLETVHGDNGSSVTDRSGRRLYDVATHKRLSRRFGRQFAAILAGTAVVCGAMIGGLHYEELPFFASWLRGSEAAPPERAS